MRISWNWLQRYVDTDLTPQQAADVLTSTGLETEGVELFERVKGMLKGVVVGEILQHGRHPDADRLSVCVVDIGGGEPLRIVCGAPNVAKGQKVLVATIGSILHMKDGTSITIKKSKIRGEESQGMICAEDELGLGESHEGIMVLDPDAEVGASAANHFGLNSDHVLEIGLTPNRTDAMGHVGVARDLIAALNHRRGVGAELQLPDTSAYQQDDEALAIKVEVKDTAACPRYAGVTLTNITVGSSPQWLQDHLLAIGLKPINNVVDVTNFVQHELGTPLHAFDAGMLKGRRIIVRKAATKEPFKTLDGRVRELDANDLVIADGEEPACIAGVFGGERTGVNMNTTSVFLESAVFDASSIRATARRHGLSTDASFRFERGVDPDITVYALQRAALLLKEVAGARISSGITDIDNVPKHPREVSLRFKDIERLTGLHIPQDDVVRILESLDIRIKDRNDRGMTVAIPRYRVDVLRTADLVEEILRIHGYDHVPLPEYLKCPPVHREALDIEGLGQQLGAHLAARGMQEVMTPSLTSGGKIVHENAGAMASLVRLRNPLSAELDVMRPTMLAGILQAIAHNINRQQRDLRFFERGRTYRTSKDRTIEADALAMAITGAHSRERWRATKRKVEIMDIKAELESILARLGLEASMDPIEHHQFTSAHEIQIKGVRLGVFGEVQRSILELYEVNQPVFFAELNEQVLLELCRTRAVTLREVPRFPSVRRDLSLLLDEVVRFEQLRKISFNAERKLLKEVDLFDVYQGNKLPSGKKSYALSFILQDAERTLTDEQVEKAMGRIKQALEKETGAELRA